MPAVFEHHLTVRDSDIDQLGHVNNVVFVEWMQTAAIAHSTAQGWPPERYLEIGAGWVARRHTIDYLKPAFLHDRIVVMTWVSGFRRVSSTRRYEIFRVADDERELLATAETNWAFVGLSNAKPQRVPPEVGGAFVIVEGET